VFFFICIFFYLDFKESLKGWKLLRYFGTRRAWFVWRHPAPCISRRVGIYIYIYIFSRLRRGIYIYIYTYVYIYMYIYTYIHTYIHTYICIYIHMCVCVCVCVYIIYKFSKVLYIVTLYSKYIRALTFENFCRSLNRRYTHKHTHKHTHTHTHTHYTIDTLGHWRLRISADRWEGGRSGDGMYSEKSSIWWLYIAKMLCVWFVN
jgi:hypothetical protein